jgi:adenylate cyclase
LANGDKPVSKLSDLRGPMEDSLSKIQRDLKELARYKAMFGALDGGQDDSDSTEREGGKGQDGDDKDTSDEEWEEVE